MSFADTFLLNSDQANFAQVSAALNALTIDYAYDVETTLINTTSTSFVDYTNLTTSITTETGQSLLVLLTAKVSVSTAGQHVGLAINYDAADVRQGVYREPTGGTAGNTGELGIWYFLASPTAAAHTIKARWFSSSGAATVYSAGANLLALAFRTS